jgi:hypothetical protein
MQRFRTPSLLIVNFFRKDLKQQLANGLTVRCPPLGAGMPIDFWLACFQYRLSEDDLARSAMTLPFHQTAHSMPRIIPAYRLRNVNTKVRFNLGSELEIFTVLLLIQNQCCRGGEF